MNLDVIKLLVVPTTESNAVSVETPVYTECSSYLVRHALTSELSEVSNEKVSFEPDLLYNLVKMHSIRSKKL